MTAQYARSVNIFGGCVKEMGCGEQEKACEGNHKCIVGMKERIHQLRLDPSLEKAGLLVDNPVTDEGVALTTCVNPRKLQTVACLHENKVWGCLKDLGCNDEVAACKANFNCHAHSR